ncbi:SDR family NAD(P)-dependent oxidoreductase [Pseudonocardia lacus]|uniref:SDR family NAD(P)-dependent oxidoreductase n=1 Tax=Pseudonocardia lacus TaxID=2835865 RepID=UPI001BDC6BCB|nr:SDR family oxidoreductase [Pseudonocardia lacus]
MAGALQDRVAVITGGASGIGRATAVRFAEEGADVVIGDLAPGDETVALVEKAGRRAHYVRTDTTSEADCDALVAAAVAEFGRVDVGVASAGISSAANAAERQARVESDAGHVVNVSTDAFRRVMDVNVIGVLQTDRALARQMLAQGHGGSIINIASTAGKIPLAGASPYCVSKAGVWMLTKVMALELARTGVRVNAVGPGYTTTPMWDVPEDSPAHRQAMSITPMGRNGTPEEQAAACLFLASAESSFMTGQILHPAGGQFTD